jgi:hypothetical protein
LKNQDQPFFLESLLVAFVVTPVVDNVVMVMLHYESQTVNNKQGIAMRPNYYWSTERYHHDNGETLRDYMENEMSPSWEVLEVDETRATIVDDMGDTYDIHAGGNGDSYNHMIRFELID